MAHTPAFEVIVLVSIDPLLVLAVLRGLHIYATRLSRLLNCQHCSYWQILADKTPQLE